MSNNGIPPLNDWQADNYPVIYDEGESQLKYVKTGGKIDVAGGGSSYLSYVALLTQAGTNAPTANVLNGNDGNYLGDIIWTRVDVGNYIGTLNGAFTNNKTWFYPSGNSNAFVAFSGNAWSGGFNLYRGDADRVFIDVADESGNFIDLSGRLSNPATISIEIRVYP
jgi:hypothetical protein